MFYGMSGKQDAGRLSKGDDMSEKKTREQREMDRILKKLKKKNAGKTFTPSDDVKKVTHGFRDSSADYDPLVEELEADELFRIMKRREF